MPAREKIPGSIKPMLATAVDKPFDSNEWIFEVKLDGFRAMTDRRHSRRIFYSRNGLSLSRKFPSIAAALKMIQPGVVLDGEVVWTDAKGRSDFQRLQHLSPGDENHLYYYVFDILYYENKDLTGLPLLERKKLLEKVVKRTGKVRRSSYIEDDGKDMFKMIRSENHEGIVAKRKDSLYKEGKRSREWLKIKNIQSQEAIIAGYTMPKGEREHFGSLLLGEYVNGKLEYMGHVGTGFTERALQELMKKMYRNRSKVSPFEEAVKTNGPTIWLKPKLVCEVNFSERTKEGILRHPVFKGLRLDKKAETITREREKPVSLEKIVPVKKKGNEKI